MTYYLPRYYILDAEHNVLRANVETWGRFFERIENRVVGLTQITSECRVSTVFLGIDHRIGGKGPPILFETMVFGGPLDQSQWRYTSWDDAETGHKVAVRKAHQSVGHQVDTEC